MKYVAALLVLPLLSGCLGKVSDVTLAPIPCVVQAKLGRDALLYPHQLFPRDRGVCLRLKYGPRVDKPSKEAT